MGTFGLDEMEEVKEEKDGAAKKADRKKKMPFAYWKVGDTEYKLKLTTEQVCKLEEKYRMNLLNLLTGGNIPALGIMLTVIQAAAAPWNHGVKYKNLQLAFDKYVEEGGTQLTLFSDVVMQILMVSGFFTENQREEMTEKMEDAKELL
ncbi:DUF6096 family protein [Clostridium sp. AM58-1XD]|uniref:DUF6096 family protein n=1 Tax=Clostridium sp. AM58-1XD TaxID=2292307 RepID=UPI000E4DA21D|nr:DUF6096 family protein [Clostridium sp. AM58-1XD]RGY95227.1 hypothetical protein DXA13_19710 [Clostridium sp. AM58-1XD]